MLAFIQPSANDVRHELTAAGKGRSMNAQQVGQLLVVKMLYCTHVCSHAQMQLQVLI